MAFEIQKEKYTGAIKPITLGTGDKAVTVGGEDCYPFHLFEGNMPNAPVVAFEVTDVKPESWPAAVREPYQDVLEDPVAWAKKCISGYGAEMIDLELISTDPNGMDRSPEDAAATVKSVSEAIDVPLVVWGSSSAEKNTDVLRVVCETCQDKPLIIGPVEEVNYRKIGAAAIAYKHKVVASTPIDINLAKQLNILLDNLGVPEDQIVIDPTTGGLGYGMEYTYSIMERIRQAALTQQDVKLQLPILCNLAKEVWKVKEAALTAEEAPTMGDPAKRAIMMEAVTASTMALSGANILVMRHPEAVELIRDMVKDLTG
jgi:acetyl-CoA decarbonylase/synthase complex subunit delta